MTKTPLTGYAIKERLEYLRGEIRAERISYGEIAELQDLADYIEPGDVELLEWAGVPEHEANTLTDYEGAITDEIEMLENITRSDAQGIAEAHAFIIQKEYTKGTKAKDAAKIIIER
jgi:hypothetical protein